jgi:hypothetical protein
MTLEAGVDYTVEAADEMKDAAEYTFTFTAVAGGNYTGTTTATFTILQKEAIAEASDIEKEYDGEVGIDPAKVVVTFVGMIPGDEDAITAGEGAITIKDAKKDAGTYDIVLDPEKFEATNYFVSKANGATLTINKKAGLKVKWNAEAEGFTKVYGGDDPELKATSANLTIEGAVEADLADIIAQTTITRAEGETVGKYAITLAAATGAYVFDNYEAPAFDANVADVFEITAATLKIGLIAQEVTYTAKTAVLPELTADMLVVTGLQGDDDKAKIFKTMPTVNIPEDAVNVGKYEVTLEGGESVDYEFEFLPGILTINPATITGTLKAQKVQQGKALNETAFTLTGIAEGDEDYFYVAAPGLADFEGTVTGAAGVYKDGLTVGIADDVIDNYTGYDKITGELEIIAAEAIILADDDDFTSEGEDDVTVTFASRTINAGSWNVLALPFEATVSQISDAFGYAAVDILKKDNTAADEVHFTVITTGSVPAFEPFLVKTTADEGKKENFDQIAFHNVKIEKMETAENYTVSDAAGNKFTGTFKAKTQFWGEQYRYMSKGAWFNAKKYTESNPVTLKPFRGYLETPSASARIFIEEPDGTVTAIDAVTFNEATAEGMYNLNGVKVNNLNRKGVYIKNGVKVIK